jgi:hypothetical protein
MNSHRLASWTVNEKDDGGLVYGECEKRVRFLTACVYV